MAIRNLTDGSSPAASPPPLIAFDRVSLRSGSRTILRNCSWQLHAGQNWAILGPQGSGKSAFARLAAGLIPQSRGEIEFSFGPAGEAGDPDGFIAYAAFGAAIDIGDYFLQARYWSEDRSPAVADFLSQESVFDINPFEIRPLPVARRRYAARLGRILDLLGIRGLLDREVHQLSNGEARKVMLAKTLLLDRRLVVLDDPFGGLDALYRKRLGGIITALAGQGMRFILVLENGNEIPACITHAAVFERGVMERSGPAVPARPVLPGQQNAPEPRLPRIRRLRRPAPLPVVMRDVDVAYGKKPILRGLSWAVRRGERWRIHGPNGAGKTTLLSLILGDHPQAYANDIRIFGRQWGDGSVRSALRRRMGWVSPELLCAFPLSEHCLDAVCSGFFDTLGLFDRCPGEKKRRARAWLRGLGIAQCERLPLGALSQGMQRIVLVARALVKDPELLILDEPFLGLDDAHGRLVARCIDRYCTASGASLILVTHEASDFLPGTMERLQLRDGRIIRESGRSPAGTGSGTGGLAA